MNTIHLKQNITAEQFETVVRVLKALNVLDETTDPYAITKEDLLALAKSDEDIKEGRVQTDDLVRQRARALCGK